MIWISFVITVIIFYTPLVGLSRVFGTQAALLLLCSIASWLLLWLVLSALEEFGNIDFFSRSGLRDGMLYAWRPHVSNNVAFVLASVILVYAGADFVLAILGVVFPFHLDRRLVILSVLTLLAVLGFWLEQRYRYEGEVRRNQRLRKYQQTEIITLQAEK
ncbi:MAG: hypothetical protein FJ005_08675 [Chloroflexi bacterium]|nr:hypothetical protein [Chloroflexota bacterium]